MLLSARRQVEEPKRDAPWVIIDLSVSSAPPSEYRIYVRGSHTTCALFLADKPIVVVKKNKDD